MNLQTLSSFHFVLGLIVVSALFGFGALLKAKSAFPEFRRVVIMASVYVLGAGILVLADRFVWAILGLELVCGTCACLLMMERAKVGAEAVLKFVCLHSVGTALVMAGLGIVCLVVGPVNLASVATSAVSDATTLRLGCVIVLVGLLCKAGAAPFHQWVPDTLQASDPALGSIIGVSYRVAALYLLSRWVIWSMQFEGVAPSTKLLLIIASVSSMVLGGLLLLPQSSLRRLLAYWTLPSIGLILVSLTVAAGAWELAVSFLSFSLCFLGCYLVMDHLEVEMAVEDLQLFDLLGAGYRLPLGLLVILLGSALGMVPVMGTIHVLPLGPTLSLGVSYVVLPAYAVAIGFAAIKVLDFLQVVARPIGSDSRKRLEGRWALYGALACIVLLFAVGLRAGYLEQLVP